MGMSCRMFHSMYRSAWLESESRRKEAEAAEKEARKEEQKANRANRRLSGGGGINRTLTSRQAIEQMRNNISGEALEEIADDIGLS